MMANEAQVAQQYRAVIQTGGYMRRADRGLIEVAGGDRLDWLNNLVTNVIKTVSPGDGNHAFVTDVKGRTLFTVGMLVHADRLWLDVDRRRVEQAMQHFDKYLITEDVQLRDRTAEMERVALVGPRAADVVSELGLGNLVPMGQLQHVRGEVAGVESCMVRNDFVGLVSAEFILTGESEAAVRAITQAAESAEMAPVDAETLRVLRVEAGIPADVDEIDAEVIPPETLQDEQAISYQKGCYLGQEVIERMRSRGVLARRLVGMKIDGDRPVAAKATVQMAGADCGRVMSCVWSEQLQALLGLGYVKSAAAKKGQVLTLETEDGTRNASVVDMPVR